MVGVAQLVEHPVVVRDVAGSSPVAHPTSCSRSLWQQLLNLLTFLALQNPQHRFFLGFSQPEPILNFYLDLP